MPGGEPIEREGRDGRDRVVPLELFFDLVFVFAFTLVTRLLIVPPVFLSAVLLLVASPLHGAAKLACVARLETERP